MTAPGTDYASTRAALRPAVRIAYAAGLRVFCLTAASPSEAWLWYHAVNDMTTCSDPFWKDWYAVMPKQTSVKFYVW